MIPESRREDRGFRLDAGESPKKKISGHDVGELLKKIGDLDTMLKSRRKDRESGHNIEESSKRKRILTRCRRATEMIGDPDTMLESR